MRLPDEEYNALLNSIKAKDEKINELNAQIKSLIELNNTFDKEMMLLKEEKLTLSKEKNYYLGKLEALPGWFKKLYPNSWH